MKREWMLMVLVLLLTANALAAECDPATVSADGWTAQAAEGVIAVTDGDGQELARLEYEKDETAQDMLFAEDYNFDGLTDLAALSRMGAANTYYAVWLRTKDGRFERCPAFDEICAPMPNALLRMIESCERNSAAEYRETRYAWRDGRLAVFRQRDVAYQDAETVRIIDRMPVDGGEQITERWMKAREWDDISGAERQAWALVGQMYKEIDAEKTVSFEGVMELDGKTYFVYPVKINRETICMLYFPADGIGSVLLDDVMNGLIDPAWVIDSEGVKAERVR